MALDALPRFRQGSPVVPPPVAPASAASRVVVLDSPPCPTDAFALRAEGRAPCGAADGEPGSRHAPPAPTALPPGAPGRAGAAEPPLPLPLALPTCALARDPGTPFQQRDEVCQAPQGWYADRFALNADLAVQDFAARLRQGFDCISQQFDKSVAPAINVDGAPSMSALLNTVTQWRVQLEKDRWPRDEDRWHWRDFARVRVDDNKHSLYQTPLRELLSKRSRYDAYNDALLRRYKVDYVHRVEVFANVHAATKRVYKFRCWSVRHARYSRQQYESAMVALEGCLRQALTSVDEDEVMRHTARIVYDLNHLTVTRRGQGAVCEVIGLSLLAARGVRVPALVSASARQPLYFWPEAALSPRELFVDRFVAWVKTGNWSFWYDDCGQPSSGGSA